eukprot:CAMPEP_0195155064 /NCGR_PEP_ID=MMETSP0448-20130528/183970_1 /TAXON_ID=66468 /ORGANISM="Heterocapsa triquestra, Strain CCMP 448" /LENGTH=352 /DNA_ID=CAMNT_0040193845 /DNA_START=1164 /DNA_END=2224 /DNA_ORIENTATION=+
MRLYGEQRAKAMLAIGGCISGPLHSSTQEELQENCAGKQSCKSSSLSCAPYRSSTAYGSQPMAYASLSVTRRGLHNPGRLWELGHRSLLEDAGPILLGHALVHDGTVSEPLHVGSQPLVGLAPAHLADLGARELPLVVAVECLPEGFGDRVADEVDESIAVARVRLEVGRQVDEVVLALEAFPVDHRKKHVTCVVVRQVLEYDSGALVHPALRQGLRLPAAARAAHRAALPRAHVLRQGADDGHADGRAAGLAAARCGHLVAAVGRGLGLSLTLARARGEEAQLPHVQPRLGAALPQRRLGVHVDKFQEGVSDHQLEPVDGDALCCCSSEAPLVRCAMVIGGRVSADDCSYA